MIFTIFRDFSVFFGFLKLFFLFYFRFLIINKNLKKGGAGPAWMRRGTQGHVAAPRGPFAAPTWRVYFIYSIILISNII